MKVTVPEPVNWEALCRDIDFLAEWAREEWDALMRWKHLGEFPERWRPKVVARVPEPPDSLQRAIAAQQQAAFLAGMAVSPPGQLNISRQWGGPRKGTPGLAGLGGSGGVW